MTDLGIAIDEANNTDENAIFASVPAPKKRSMRAAINAYCRDCTYDDAFKGGGTWRAQVEACTVTKCALYEFRPVTIVRKTDDTDEE